MLDLAIVRKHLREPPADEDDLISGYIDAALAFIEKHCDRKLVAGEPADESEMAFTKDVQQAALLLIGHWYSNREAVVVGASVSAVPMAVESLLWYRKRF